jgi:hypothetical protein
VPKVRHCETRVAVVFGRQSVLHEAVRLLRRSAM